MAKVPIYADVNAVMSLTISLDGKRMERLLRQPMEELGGVSFPEKLRQSLDMAAENTSSHPPELLILTGGASRMAFFRQACKDAFPHAEIVCCKEPEFSIARGLAIAAKMDQQLAVFRREIEIFFASGTLRKDIDVHLPALQEKLTPVLQQRIMANCVTPALQQHVNDQDQLNELVRANIEKEFQAQGRTTETDEIIAKWISSELNDTQHQLDDICARNSMEKADMALSKIALNVKLDHLKTFPAVVPMVVLKVILSLFHIHLPPIGAAGRIREALKRELTDPSGDFAKSLAKSMEAELRTQIQDNVDKVEMVIS